MSGFEVLYKNVIETGLCTNCGTCAAVCPRNAIKMDYELEEAYLAGECSGTCNLCVDICPGEDINLPQLNMFTFGRNPTSEESNLGVRVQYHKCYAVDDSIREAGAGGGVVSALLCYAVDSGLINGAVVAGMNDDKPWRVEPKLATNREEILSYAQSRYSSSPTNEILGEAVRSGKNSLGIVGLPCHIHSIRKMQAINRPITVVNAIKFTISLFCGINSHHQTWEHLIEESVGIPLENVAGMDFRAGAYPGVFRLTLKDGNVITRGYASLTGAPFSRDRCQMCYDYSGELSDLSVGDYYHPDMKPGVKGWSCLITRSETGKQLVESAMTAGYIHCEPVEESYMLGLGWEQKRHVGVFRLLERHRHNWPTPNYHIPLEYPLPQQRKVEMKPPYHANDK